jgi:sarcosine oxidase subunit alpha
MPSMVAVRVNGVTIEVAAGCTVAVAAMLAGHSSRTSVTGGARGPLCGMGTCFECRMTINGRPHCGSCQILCESGMDIRTDE